MKINYLMFNKVTSFVIFTIFLLSNCYLGNNFKSFYDALTIGLTCIILFLYVFFSFRVKNDLLVISFSLFLLFMAIACFLGTYSSIITFLHIYYPIIGIILYLLMSYFYNEESTIKSLDLSLKLLIIINLLTIFLFPNGLYSNGVYDNNWFFKYDNLHVMMFLPSFLLDLIVFERYRNKYNSLFSYINWIIITASILICKSANTIVSFIIIIIFGFYWALRSNRKIKNEDFRIIKNSNTLFYIYMVLFFGIVIFRMQDIFSWIIVNFLHKNLTFSNRTIIWDRIIDYIKLKPFWGYGIENTNVFVEKMGNQSFTHAHNTLLDIFYKGGLFSLTFFLLFLKQIINSINKIKGKYSDMYKITFFSLMIMTIVEAREEKMGFYLVLFILYCISEKKRSKISANKK